MILYLYCVQCCYLPVYIICDLCLNKYCKNKKKNYVRFRPFISFVGKKCNIALRYKNLIEVEEIEKELEEEEDEDPVIQMRKIK